MNLIKKEIIPENLKSNIDQILEEQLLNANRNYAEDNKEIYEIIENFIKIHPKIYIKELIDRWNWHNKFYEDTLEPAYSELMNLDLDELTPEQVDEFIRIYKTCLNVDKATMITSCGIKKHLDYWVDKISIQNEDLNKSDSLFMLLTPLKEPFYVQYQIDHLKYIMLKKMNDPDVEIWENYLLDMYHANDKLIFKSRYIRDFKDKENLDIKNLKGLINSYKFNESYKAKHYYFMLEHPERKAFNDILSYDNYEEKLLAFQLIGISGFLYRKSILNILNESNILKNNGYIYEFPDQIILDSLCVLKEKTNHFMEKKVQTYKQTFDSCAIVCMLSVLKYYNKIDRIDLEKEKSYFNKYKSKHLIGTPFSAIAYELSLNDLSVNIYHSSNSLFENNNNYISSNLFDNGMQEYKFHLNKAVKKGTEVFNGINIDSNFLLDQLKSNKLIILAGNSGKYLHAILLCGYKCNNFIVFDPLIGKKKILSSIELESFMRTNIGTWCISIKNRTLKKDKLMDDLNYFDISATEKINFLNTDFKSSECCPKKYVKKRDE